MSVIKVVDKTQIKTDYRLKLEEVNNTIDSQDWDKLAILQKELQVLGDLLKR